MDKGHPHNEHARQDAWLAEWDRRAQAGERTRDISRSIAAREGLSLGWVQSAMRLARLRRQSKLEHLDMRGI